MNTVILVKSSDGYIFGGFSSEEWRSYMVKNPTDAWEKEPNAFVFGPNIK
jgi:hypothetical protein